jgi:ankyrin repeat protein
MIAYLGDPHGPSLDLEELVPEPFRIRILGNSHATDTVSGNLPPTQAVFVGLFLATNNLLDSSKLVELVQHLFDTGYRHLFKQIFKLKSSTIQAFSCRILESICYRGHIESSDSLMNDLLLCGLDRGILAGPTGGRCLQIAIRFRRESLALLLLKNGVQRDPKLGSHAPFDRTPVRLAMKHGQKRVLQILLNQDQQQVHPLSEPQRNKGELALKEACIDRNLNKIRFLLNSGVNVDYDRNSIRVNGCPSKEKPILEWAFLESEIGYSLLLPYSEFSRQFWTCSGILFAASFGHESLETYFACRRCPEDEEIDLILDTALYDGMNYHKEREVLVLLGLDWATERLDLDAHLKTAATWEYNQIMKKLLQLGARPVHLEDNQECNLIQHALVEGPQAGCLKEFLENKLFAWERVFLLNFGSFPKLTSQECFRNLKFLIEVGPDVNSAMTSTFYGKILTPFQATIEFGTLDMVKYLIQAGASVNGTSKTTCYTPLGQAVHRVWLEVVCLFLSMGADVKEFADHKGTTLLELLMSLSNSWARTERSIKPVFNVLRRAGAELNHVGSRNPSTNWNTALTTALLSLNTSNMIWTCLEHGADVNQIGGGRSARTPLQAAAECGCISVIHELLKRGAYINAPAAPVCGRTALQAAVEKRREYIVRGLLRRGASVNAPAAPDHGRTALQAACGHGNKAKDMILLLLDEGADVSAPAAPRFGQTALQALCSNESPSSELMALLIKKGADINAPPAQYGGTTALQGAAMWGNLKIILLLIDMGADVNASPSASVGRMALDGAAEHGRLDTVQLLLTFGATCMVPGNTGYDSAIEFAEENGHFVIADILRGHKG